MDNVVGAGTIFDYDMDGDNMKVSMDMVANGNCFVPIPTREGMTMFSQEVGSHLLWPRHLMKSVYQADPRLPSLTLNTKRAPVTLRLLLWELDYIGLKIQIHIPAKVFGYQQKCCIFLEALQEFCQMQPISTQCIDAFMLAFDISNKKKPIWRIIKCPKQGGIVECRYYVMRFMRDIILSSNRTIIEVVSISFYLFELRMLFTTVA
ncbi:hypothetical protein IC575_009063 [Cucumis melo]